MQLGVGLGHLGVAGRQQRAPGEHRVGLRDLAAEELDGEGGHWRARQSRSPDLDTYPKVPTAT